MSDTKNKSRNKNEFIIKIIAIAVAACMILSYLIYQVVQVSKSEMETQFALYETVYKTIETKSFVLRDEEFILNNETGTTVSFADNGERVARGDTVSVIFDTPEDASSYLQISEVEENLAHYRELAGQGNFQAMNIDTMTEKLQNEFIDFLEATDTNDYDEAIELAEAFRDSLTGRQIAVGEKLDFTEQITALENSLTQLKSNEYNYTEVKSEKAGYYISGSDGFENVIKFSDVDSVDVKEIESAISSKPSEINSSAIGRIVGSFTWYFLCVVDSAEIITLSNNANIFINVPYKGIERLPVKVHKIGDRTQDKTTLILSCDVMNDSLADLRVEDIEIITEEYNGYKIAHSAIRTVDGEKGVYIVRGNIVGFRKVNIVYSTDDFTIVNNPEGRDDYIKLYDKVVTKGVEVYDNKLV